MLSPTIDTVRLFIHVLAASVWVGGQIVLAGVVPGLRSVGPEATKAAANGFARVAWPAFAIAFATGIWNLLAVDPSSSTEYNITLGIKVLLVVAAGFSAFQHSRTSNTAVRAATGALGAVASVVVLFLGVLMGNPS
jgi:putative copper export protein